MVCTYQDSMESFLQKKDYEVKYGKKAGPFLTLPHYLHLLSVTSSFFRYSRNFLLSLTIPIKPELISFRQGSIKVYCYREKSILAIISL